MAADGSSYSWPDGELVTPDKLAAWLSEDILLRRVKAPVGKGKRGPRPHSAAAQLRREQGDAAALIEAKSLAEDLDLPLAEAVELLSDDREGYVPPAGLVPEAGAPPEAEAEAEALAGTLLTRGTVDAYVAAVIELWRV